MAGLDLGSSSDHSAIIVVRRTLVEIEPMDLATFEYPLHRMRAVVSVERIPLSTPYSAVAKRVVEVDEKLRLLHPDQARAHWWADRTGLGAPVCEELRGRLGSHLHAVSFTGGLEVGGSLLRPNVPKVSLITWVMADLQNGDLVLATGVQHLEMLERELLGLGAKRTAAGRLVMEATTATHDDLVCAAALANYGSRRIPLSFPVVGRRLL
jgi:hypothetical protein